MMSSAGQSAPLQQPPAPSNHHTAWAWAVATWFGAGRLRPGPGTWGSVAAMLLWLAAAQLAHHAPYFLTYVTGPGVRLTLPDRFTLGVVTLLGVLLTFIIGVPAASIVARESHTADPQHVVIDEVCGQWIALLFMPPTWKSALLCLALFRVFDIVKPPPARQMERLHGGAGVMLDDVAAGIYALICAQMLQHWIHL